jgi:hypothetical protein
VAERKADTETREQTSEEREHAAAARAAGQQLGPRKLGGTILEADGRVTYTKDGAVSATAHGPVDSTVQPGQFEEPGGGVTVVDRGDAAPLTEDAEKK